MLGFLDFLLISTCDRPFLESKLVPFTTPSLLLPPPPVPSVQVGVGVSYGLGLFGGLLKFQTAWCFFGCSDVVMGFSASR